MAKNKQPILTHIALRVKNIEESVSFYKKYVDLDLISIRMETHTRVAWLGNPEIHDSFVIVLLEMPYENSVRTSYDHLGIDLNSRERVDAVAARARAEGILSVEPEEYGPVAGYLCMVRDPDGNQVEFSSGQHVFEVLTPEVEP